MKIVLLLAGLSLLGSGGVAQELRVAPGIRLPADAATREALVGSLRGWLAAVRNEPDSMNEYVAAADRPGASPLMEDMRRLKGDCYLGDVSSVDSVYWQVQLNYLGMQQDTPYLQACCTVLARRAGDRFYISSPLAQNTVGWKSRTIGCCTFYYKTGVNVKKAIEFERQIASYDKRLGVRGANIDFYCCDNRMEAMKLLGEDYFRGYNGRAFEEFGGESGSRTVVVSGGKPLDGFNDWDTHDWWHGRLHRVVRPAIINRPVDEGMAYLYGGSWRIYQWKDILKLIGDYRVAHPGADWLSLYKEGTNLIPPPKIIKVSYAINALIVQRLEKEHGFAATLPLLCCGPKVDGDANYFTALKEVTGVDERGFNAYVDDLLRTESR